jgi:uncharacterized protein (TIGR02996 family)
MMTTEDDFQAALDANPADWQTRLVFADWLQERGDPRADGYRALGLNRRVFSAWDKGYRTTVPTTTWLVWDLVGEVIGPDHNSDDLPRSWFQLLAGGKRGESVYYLAYPSRREAENASALAFSQLPATRRAELLGA